MIIKAKEWLAKTENEKIKLLESMKEGRNKKNKFN